MRPRILVQLAVCSSLMGALFLGAGTMTTGQTTTVAQATPKAKATTEAESAAPAPLDLNTATAEELQETLPGVGEVTARKIVAGRPYAKVDDLARAGVPARTIEAIRGMVTVSAPPVAPEAKAKAKAAAKDQVKAAATTARPAGPVNLNTASLEDLQTLPGIEPAHAREIIAGRPYTSVDDLERVKGLGKTRIDAIRNRVTASMPAPAPTATPATPKATTTTGTAPKAATTKAASKPGATRFSPGKKVHLNTASKEELDALPGIGPVRAQGIIEGRPFKSIEEIKKVKGIKDHEFNLIKDRITVD